MIASYVSARRYDEKKLKELWWTVLSCAGSEIRGKLMQSEDKNIVWADIKLLWALILWVL